MANSLMFSNGYELKHAKIGMTVIITDANKPLHVGQKATIVGFCDPYVIISFATGESRTWYPKRMGLLRGIIRNLPAWF